MSNSDQLLLLVCAIIIVDGSTTEAKTLADTEHKRNYAACLKGYGYCDPSRLTVEEARMIHPGN